MAFARIGVFTAPPTRMPALVALFRDRITPVFETHPGFLGYQAFTDAARGQYVGISYWASLSALEASDTAARTARDAAAELGAALLGEPLIVREAFDTRPARRSPLPRGAAEASSD